MATSHKKYELTVDEQKTLSKAHSGWPLRWMSEDVRPYAELIRLHKPAGIMAFYFPCLYGTLLVGVLRQNAQGQNVSLALMVIANLKLFLLSFLMRCTFVTFNDLVDQDFDRQVSRTRIRPLARGAISTRNAIVWNLIQLVFLGGAFTLLSPQCMTNSLLFILFHTLYPLGKRLTHHPQLVLGLAFNHGTFLAFPALNQPFSLWSLNRESLTIGSLSAAIFFWTILYDTIYSAQDIEDDVKAGVGSPVIYWGDSLKPFLRVLGVLIISSLVLISRTIKETNVEQATTLISTGFFFDLITCGGTLLGLILMVERVNLKDPNNCGWWFNQGNVLIGYVIGAGLLVEYMYSRF